MGTMLEAVRTREAVRTHEPASWGIVDAILAVIMLPFGIWMWLIDRAVAGIAFIFDR